MPDASAMLPGAALRGAFTLRDAAVLAAPDRDAAALVWLETGAPPRTFTRAAFTAAAHACAAHLAAHAVGPGSRVLILDTQTLDSVFAFWGCVVRGAVPAMLPALTEKLDPAHYADGITRLIARSGAVCVCAPPAFAPTLAALCAERGIAVPIIAYTAMDVARDTAFDTAFDALADTPAPPPTPDAVALLQHSSGTTGLQKGVALSHRAIGEQLSAYAHALALTPRDTVVSWLPLYHDMGLIAGFLLPLVLGLPLVLMSPFDWVVHPAMLLRALSDHAGTLCWLPNFAYAHTARRVRRGDLVAADGTPVRLDGVRMFINCSEPVTDSAHRLFLERFAPFGVRAGQLAVCYAMAENTFAVTQTPPETPPRVLALDRAVLEREGRAQPARPGSSPDAAVTDAGAPDAAVVYAVSCGVPIAGCRVRVVARNTPTGSRALVSVSEGTVGEIAIHSPSLFSGYDGQPDLDPFVEGWYLTGDLGFMHEGELFISGRAKDLIIVRGRNLFPGDIEAVVNTVSGVYPGRVVAFGIEDAREGTQRVVVIAEVRPEWLAAQPGERAAAIDALAAAVRAAVTRAADVTPAFVACVDERWLLKTSSGKIMRGAARDKWLREQAGETPTHAGGAE
jgi:acyl-CoA synthetase (AMP-forming)/AMP-acid ligase II